MPRFIDIAETKDGTRYGIAKVVFPEGTIRYRLYTQDGYANQLNQHLDLIEDKYNGFLSKEYTRPAWQTTNRDFATLGYALSWLATTQTIAAPLHR